MSVAVGIVGARQALVSIFLQLYHILSSLVVRWLTATAASVCSVSVVLLTLGCISLRLDGLRVAHIRNPEQ